MQDEKPTLLVVEDDVDIAEMLMTYFRAQEFEVATVNWGRDAEYACRSLRPDLIILDIRLPDIDGFEVARRLRSNRRTMDIPIIFLTEKLERSDRILGLRVGADDYITKPFDIHELRLRVSNALRRREMISLADPITGLPKGELVDERLRECLESADWALLLVSIENLDAFREVFGFVATDDILRAISLMISNAMRGFGSSNDFVGQLGAADFILVTTPDCLEPLTGRIHDRMARSLDYFYPMMDGRVSQLNENRLRLSLSRLTNADRRFSGLADLKSALVH